MNDTTTILFGTLLPFFLTSAGSAMVFFFREKSSALAQRLFLGFAAGVMIAASVWGLLMPAIEEAEASGGIGWIPAAGGFVLGAAVLMLLDTFLPHIHPASGEAEGLPSSWRRTTLMVSAVTLHNIPEGMAVGLSLALAVQRNDSAALTAALALSLGIGIQNFPEGAAVSLPLRQDGMGRFKAFVYGSLSGVVEPIFGLLTVLDVYKRQAQSRDSPENAAPHPSLSRSSPARAFPAQPYSAASARSSSPLLPPCVSFS